MKTQNNIAQMLTQNGIRPSIHRVVILQYLISVKTHPSADKVYEELMGQLPTLSKATVYNTLNLFTEKGVAKLITIDPNEKRFDADTQMHAHFRCNNCGILEDIFLKPEKINAFNIKSDHNIISKDFYMTGVCSNCSNEKKYTQNN